MLYEANSYAHNSRHALWLDDAGYNSICISPTLILAVY